MSTGSKTIAELPEVQILNDEDQFLFFQNSTKETKRITKANMANSGGGLRGVFINATTNENVWGVADFARTTANAANISSSGAQASANGRNKIFYQIDPIKNGTQGHPKAGIFQGYISGTTLNADALSNTGAGGVPIRVGSFLTGTGISAGTVVAAFGTGSGGAGTYIVNNSQTVGSVGSKIPITADPQFLEGDIWYETDNNYRTYRRSSASTWLSAFAPILSFNGSNKVSGFVRVSDINGTIASDEFAVVASQFQIWNGSSDEAPFTVDASSPASTFTATIAGSILTLTSVATNTLKLGTNLTGTGVAADTVIRILLSGAIGVSGSTYLLSKVSTVSSAVSMTASYAGQVRITDALIQTLDAGKITSGFLSSQVIELPNSNSYIQSASFVETWVTGKLYTKDGERLQPSDQSRVKVLANDGTYTVYKATATHTSGGTFAGDVSNWTSTGVSQSLQGFRIVGNGQADFQDCTVLGTIRSSVGHFGTSSNAVKIDSAGLVIGTSGSIISSGVSWADGGAGSKGTFSGTGFFLGYTGGSAVAYQFHIGNPSGNYLRWDGSVLQVNGNIVGGSTVGAGSNDVGLVMNTQFGIRRSVNNGTLTLTGGNGNGILFGSQIDLVGTEYIGASGNAEGQLILSAGYDSTHTAGGDSRDGCIIFRTSREASSVDIGVQRLRIDLDGTVKVVNAGNAFSTAPDSGAGKFVAETNIKTPYIFFGTGSDTSMSITNNFGSNNALVFAGGTGASGAAFRWVNSGNSSQLATLSTAGVLNATSFMSSSSKRFKKKIKNLKNGLSIVGSLRPVIFDWETRDLKNDIGLIAEEVEKIIPSIVSKNEKGECVGLDYSKLTVVLIQAVKQLQLEVERLKNKIK